MGNYTYKYNPISDAFDIVQDMSLIHMKDAVDTYNDLPITGNSENDARFAKDTDILWVWSVADMSGTLDEWKETAKLSIPQAESDMYYYINCDTGDDNNPGTAGEPFETIQHAIDILPKFLGSNQVLIRLQPSLNYQERVDIQGFYGGFIWIKGDEGATPEDVVIKSVSSDIFTITRSSTPVYINLLTCITTQNNVTCISYDYGSCGYVRQCSFGAEAGTNAGTIGVYAYLNSSAIARECGNASISGMDAVETGLKASIGSRMGHDNTPFGDNYLEIITGGFMHDDTYLTNQDRANFHIPNTDQYLDFGGGNQVAVADVKDVVDNTERKNLSSVTYYINSDTGDDENDGSSESPFLTIQHALDITPKLLGDTTLAIRLQTASNYYERADMSGFYNGYIYIRGDSGTPEDAIIIESNGSGLAINKSSAFVYIRSLTVLSSGNSRYLIAFRYGAHGYVWDCKFGMNPGATNNRGVYAYYGASVIVRECGDASISGIDPVTVGIRGRSGSTVAHDGSLYPFGETHFSLETGSFFHEDISLANQDIINWNDAFNSINKDTILLSGGSGAEELINNGILQINLLPNAPNTLELGSQSLRYKKIWVGGGSVEIGNYSIKTDVTDDDGLEIPATLHIRNASGVSGNICLHSGTEPTESLSATGHRLWMDASGNLQHIKPSSGGNRQIAYGEDLHAHSNKTLLDTYTQTEVDIADAVSLKHWNNNDHIHANHPELDSITDGFHDSRTNDPHNVTKAQVGLTNVPNLDTTNAVNKAHDQNSDTDLDSTFELTFVKKLDNVNVLADITSPGANIESAVTKRHTKNEDYKIEFVGVKASRVGCWGGERPEFSFITFIEYDEEIMRITNGKVGIRTDTPVEQLDVRGAVIAKDGFATKLWDIVGANFEIADPYIEYISPNQQGGRYGTVYRQYWSGSLSDNDVIVSSIATRVVDGYINKRSGSTRFPGGISDMESASWHARYGLLGTSGANDIFIDLAGYTTIAGWVDYTKT